MIDGGDGELRVPRCGRCQCLHLQIDGWQTTFYVAQRIFRGRTVSFRKGKRINYQAARGFFFGGWGGCCLFSSRASQVMKDFFCGGIEILSRSRLLEP